MKLKLCATSLACILMLAACGGDDDNNHAAPGGETQPEQPTTPTPEVPDNGSKSFVAMCESALNAAPATASNLGRSAAATEPSLLATQNELIYEANFSAMQPGMLPAGWSVISTPESTAQEAVSVSNGALILDGRGHNTNMTTLALPAELDNTENFRLEATFTLLEANDSGRWGSFMYRTTPGASKHPYFQFAIRKAATGGSGLEFAERTAANGWNVRDKKPFSENIDAEKTYHVTIIANGNRVRQYINNVLIHDVTLPNGARQSGGFGISTAGLRMRVDSLQIYNQTASLPEIPQPLAVQEIAPQITMAPSISHAIMDEQQLNNGQQANQQLFCVDSQLNLSAGDKTPLTSLASVLAETSRSTLTQIYVSDTATANALIQNSKTMDLSDVTLVSDNAELLRSIRLAIPNSRAALDLSRTTLDDSLTSILAAVDATNTAMAKIVILPPALVTRANVERMQGLLVTPWASSTTDNTAQAAQILTTGVNGVLASHPEVFAQVLKELPANTLLRNPSIIGHRGIPGLADENTLEGAKLAVQLGANAIENDIYKTVDDHLVIMHDNDVKRTTSGSGAIESMTLEQVKQLRTSSGYEVPTMMEYFETFKQTPMVHVVELKSTTPAVVDLLAKEMQEAGTRDQVVTISFSTAQIERMKNIMPNISVGYLSGGSDQLKNILESTQTLSTTYNPGWQSLTEPVMEAAKHRGVTFWPWTVNEQAAFARLYTQGVGGITTDHADWAGDYPRKIELVEPIAALKVGSTLRAPKIRITDQKGKESIGNPSFITVLPDSVESSGSQTAAVSFKKAGKATVLLGYTYSIPNSSSFYNLVSAPIEITVEE